MCKASQKLNADGKVTVHLSFNFVGGYMMIKTKNRLLLFKKQIILLIVCFKKKKTKYIFSMF